MVYKWLNNVQNWLLPNNCTLCGQRGQENLALCRDCQLNLNTINSACERCAIPLPDSVQSGICGQCIIEPPNFDNSISLFVYETPISQMIQSLKFNRKLANARLLGNLLATHLEERKHPRPTCILPVPLHHKRLQSRGFNQSLELAKPVSRVLDIPITQHLVKRIRHTPPQSRLKFRERDKNVNMAFELNGHAIPKRVAILDDVVTTGATCNAIAGLLKKAGAEHVEVWSLARSLK